MLVKEIMSIDYITLAPETSFFEAAKMLLENRASGAPVIDQSGNLVGLVSEKDLFRALYPSYHYFYLNPESFLNHDEDLREATIEAKQKKVIDIMSKRPIIATPETNILKIGGLMVASGIHHVPVVENGKVVGMISRGNIYRAILQDEFDLHQTK